MGGSGRDIWQSVDSNIWRQQPSGLGETRQRAHASVMCLEGLSKREEEDFFPRVDRQPRSGEGEKSGLERMIMVCDLRALRVLHQLLPFSVFRRLTRQASDIPPPLTPHHQTTATKGGKTSSFPLQGTRDRGGEGEYGRVRSPRKAPQLSLLPSLSEPFVGKMRSRFTL